MKTNQAIFLSLLLLTFSSCTGLQSGANNWGRFSGPIDARWTDNGRNMQILQDVHYYAPDERDWFAPKDSVVNGASIPKAFWSIIGGPFEGKYRNASVFHDVACDQRKAAWQDVHQMFYNAMRCSGVGESKAKIMFAAVYEFGPKWTPQKSGSHGRFPASGTKPTLNHVTQPTKDQVQRLNEWVEKQNPSLETIKAEAHAKAAPVARPPTKAEAGKFTTNLEPNMAK
jgi:hypothetical protein